MGKIIRNGVQYTSDGNTVSCELTWAEYNALSDADKMNGMFYYITDIEPYNENNAPLGFTPIGTIISVMGNHAPFNYLKCDGSVYNIIDYPELANYFEIEFGSKNKFGGNGTTTFAVPDLQGEFLRGTGTNSHTEQGNGGDVGTHQDATILPEFAHDLDSQTVYLPNPILTGASTTNSDSRPSKWANNVAKKSRYKVSVSAFDTYLDGSGGAIVTSRPTNTSVLYCIATKNIYLEPKNMYSTDEQVVGQWIDGKPIYQKTILTSVSNLTAGSNQWIRIVTRSDINLDRLIDISTKVVFTGHENDEYIIPYYAIESFGGVNETNPVHVAIATGASGISVQLKQNFYNATLSGTITSTIQYTKTTDTV